MKASVQLDLDKFKAREYQRPLINAFKAGKRKILAIWPRRSGKDLVAWNLMIRAALGKKGIYYYVLPTYSQAKKVLFEGMTNDGTRFQDYIPKELIRSINSTEMKIFLINGSLIQFVGSMDYDRLMGTNPIGCVFSEYSLSDPMALQYMRPILMANGGWLIVISTPRGHNALWDLFNIASTSEDWYCSKLTVDDTQHISLHEIKKEIASGEISEELAQQEYWSSFSHGILGSFYCKELDRMRLDNRITSVPWESSFEVHTSWDIGLDMTSIVFFQVMNNVIHIIDYYENSNLSLDHYIGVIKSKPYTVWGQHIGPHDMANREFTTGISRLDIAKNLGVEFTLAPNVSIMDGIESVRSMLSRCYIDDIKCKRLIKCIENYRQTYDDKRQGYTGVPYHDQFSHGADALRMAALSLNKLIKGLTAQDLDKIYEEAVLGDRPRKGFFRDDDENTPRY